jgi:hypothetical protein
MFHVIFLQRTPPEDSHNWWPEHVGGYADYKVMNLIAVYVLVCNFSSDSF